MKGLSPPRALIVAVPLAGFAAASLAQDSSLRSDQVVVVYDDRIPESLLVAEHYAGSAKVPGGLGNKPAARPGVRVMNLDVAGVPVAVAATITRTQFNDSIRTPLRTWLNVNDPTGQVRCILLTKGLAHRIEDSDNPAIGDDPLNNTTELAAGDLTCASVDSELTLLQLNLASGENGNRSDSFADGMIVNPYHNQSQPINAWSTRQRRNNRVFDWLFTATLGNGLLARSRTVPAVQVLTPGDIYMVCRLDGNTLADVYALIDRARDTNRLVNTDSAAIVLDESRAGAGVENVQPNTELDNDALDDGVEFYLRIGDDLERTRDQAAGDGRFPASGIVYNAAPSPAGFVVGPRIDFAGGTIVSAPVVLYAGDGSNSDGAEPGNSGHDLPLSLNWSPMGCYLTFESYNGRQFQGLTPLFNQSQAAVAVSPQGGATFAIGNVYEPYSFSLPDAEVVSRNFYRGRLSWAEAAWSALPALSWQQVVIGDPLARVVLSNHDLNADGAWTIEDLYLFESSVPTARTRDVNRSGTVDNSDRLLIDPAPRPADHADMAGTQR